MLARFRQLRRQWRLHRLLARLSRADRLALTGQAVPRPAEVLVVRNDSIGDYLLYRPWLRLMAQEIRGRGQRLTLAANAVWAPLAQAWDADVFDELVIIDFGRFGRDLAYRAQVLHGLGAVGFGEIIYPLHVREPAVENCFRFFQAPVRVGSEGEHHRGGSYDALNAAYTRLLPAAPAVLFEYLRNQEFFEQWRGLPWPEPLPSLAPPVVPLGAPAPYIVLFPGASAKAKRWPARHFARLARGLHQHYGPRYRLVLAGSRADHAQAELIRQAADAAGPDNRCGHTTLPELAALVAGAALLVSNDTVAAHLAAQAGIPVLTVLMGENYGKFFPYPPALLRAPSRCLFPPDMEARFAAGDFTRPASTPNIAQISPARVLAAAAELLGPPA